MSCKLRHLGAVGLNITDETLRGLAGAPVVTLSASRCSAVTNVAPVAATLRKLDASGRCGIDDAGLAQATRIEYLHATNNRRIRTVAPFAPSLRKLLACVNCGIDDAGLALATRIEVLFATHNGKICTVSPFAASLRVLFADEGCGINDAGLLRATRIEHLHARNNPGIRTVAPFAQTLLKLATNLEKLCAWGNRNISRSAINVPSTSSSSSTSS